MSKDVIVLYNLPREAGEGKSDCKESDAGVINEVKAVAAAMEKLGVSCREVGIRGISELHNILIDSAEEIVFNLVEELPNSHTDAAVVPTMCKAYGKECTGNDSAEILLAMDKNRAKGVLEQAKLPCPESEVIAVGEKADLEKLFDAPYIVKPVYSDASEGIDEFSVFKEKNEKLSECVQNIHNQFRQAAMIEKFVGSRELNVSVVQFGNEVKVLPIAEIDFSAFGKDKPKIVGYSAKWVADSFEYNNTPRKIPAEISNDTADKIIRCAKRAWKVLGCRDYARVDLRMDDNEKFYILEVNPNPDISPDAGFAAALAAAEISYEKFVEAMIENAEKRLGASTKKSKAASAKNIGEIKIRRADSIDRNDVLVFMANTGFFRSDEMEIAAEVFDDAVKKGEGGHYQSFVAQAGAKAIGWVCYGTTPCTVGTFDIYWIGVDKNIQAKGIGAALLEFAENKIRQQGGRLTVIETSSRDVYLPTRKFYLARGYREVTRVKDFYATNDDKVIYTKRLKKN